MTRWYMLDENRQVIPAPMEEDGLLPAKEYFIWFESEGIIIKQDTTVNGHWVSTVFLGMDHGFGQDGYGPPIVFETMILPSSENMHERERWRYCTYEEALEGHKNACRIAMNYGSGIEPEELKKAAGVITDLLNKES